MDPTAPVDRATVLAIHDALCAAYDAPFPFFSTKDPTSELISALLSHRTKNRFSGQAYKQLRERFPTWPEVRDAPTAAVEEALAPCTWPEQKAPRIQAVLREIGERTDGTFDLYFLRDLPVPEARAWLESITGVGPKTSAATLLFSKLRIAALPVDSHHQRVTQRLGWSPKKMGPGPAHGPLAALMPEGWDAQTVYDHHEALMYHGQKCCYFQRPACERCPILAWCPTGQAGGG
ncbi:MAG: Fe-S cluster assembly protein HesB [Catalinimonas sp.]